MVPLFEGAQIEELANQGWTTSHVDASDDEAIANELVAAARSLGELVPGRLLGVSEVIRPLDDGDAHPRSLSAVHGLGALPFHTELSHRLRPCRYVILACLDPGLGAAATTTLDWRGLGFTEAEMRHLSSAPILARSGRRSFYTNILPVNRRFLRYDRDCLEPVDKRGETALDIVKIRLSTGKAHRHTWRRGNILLIDNWRCLHGREATIGLESRRLLRVLINDR